MPPHGHFDTPNQWWFTVKPVGSPMSVTSQLRHRRFLRAGIHLSLSQLSHFRGPAQSAKFDKAGRIVEVRTDLSDGLAIVISDTGWGILMDTLKLILTKSLIKRHRGNLSIVGTSNNGVAVRLLFPLERIVQRLQPAQDC
jgi:hypothetical protein